MAKKLQLNYLNETEKKYRLEQANEFDKSWKKEAWDTYYYQGPDNVMETQFYLSTKKASTNTIQNDAGLNLIAKKHAEFLASKEIITHKGLENRSPLYRYALYGNQKEWKNLGENIMAIKCKNLAIEKARQINTSNDIGDAEAVL